MNMNEIDQQLSYVAEKMFLERCISIHHLVELESGEKYMVHIKKLKGVRKK